MNATTLYKFTDLFRIKERSPTTGRQWPFGARQDWDENKKFNSEKALRIGNTIKQFSSKVRRVISLDFIVSHIPADYSDDWQNPGPPLSHVPERDKRQKCEMPQINTTDNLLRIVNCIN